MGRKNFLRLAGILTLSANIYGISITDQAESRKFNKPGGGTFTSSGKINQHTDYKVGNIRWEVNAVPFPLQTPSNLDFAALDVLMKTQFPDWTVSYEPLSDDDNSFVVHTYDARTLEDQNGTTDLVGAELQVDFSTADPTLIGAPLHWVQIITTDTPGNGKPTPRIDTFTSATPFLDVGNPLAGPDFFYDFPNRNYSVQNVWSASLFLVEGSNSSDLKTMTVLGGLDWGFENHCDAVRKRDLEIGGACPVCGCSASTPEPGTSSLVGVTTLIAALVLCSKRSYRWRNSV
jgi:hypothetical protein